MRGTTALVVVTMLLGGCASGAAEPASTTIGAAEPSQVVPAPSVEVSVKADADEELEPPEMPALAREQTPEGAVAFAEWWFDTLNYATASGDTEQLRTLSLGECETCGNLITEIERAYAQGGSMQGGSVDVAVDSPGGLRERGALLVVFAEIDESRILSADGELVKRYDPERETMTFTAALIDAQWRAGGLVGTEL